MSKTLRQRSAIKANVKKEVDKLQPLRADVAAYSEGIKGSLIKLTSYHERILQYNETILDELEEDAAVDREINEAAQYDDWMLDEIVTAKSALEQVASAKAWRSLST